MADLRIVDAPEIPTENITGEEKLPTGGSGNYSISLDSLADYTKTKKDLADNTSVDGKVNGVRQELDAHIEDLLNPHQVTKGQIGLGNVDNTADADKPVSNSTQAAIISAVAPKSDKSYVDNQLTLKANKADVYTKSETYTKQESSNLVNNSISTALTPINTSLDLAKRGVINRYDPSLTYNSGERVILTNGDIVKSTINGNTNDPNVNMTGWVKTNSASQIFDESGLTQQEINNSRTINVNTIQDLLNIKSPKNGDVVFVKSYNPQLLVTVNPFVGKGGGFFEFTGDVSLNNGITTYNGWSRKFNGVDYLFSWTGFDVDVDVDAQPYLTKMQDFLLSTDTSKHINLIFESGQYNLKSIQYFDAGDGQYFSFVWRSNMTIKSNGAVTIKLPDSIFSLMDVGKATAKRYDVFSSGFQNTKNVEIKGIKIDFNADSNYYQTPSNIGSKLLCGVYAMRDFAHDKITVDGCIFYRNPSFNSVLFGEKHTRLEHVFKFKNMSVTNCQFINGGDGANITLNKVLDHSSVYVSGWNFLVSNNTFINDSNSICSCGTEAHNFGMVSNNKYFGYSAPILLVSEEQLGCDIVCESNTIRGAQYGIAFAMGDNSSTATIKNNSIKLRSKKADFNFQNGLLYRHSGLESGGGINHANYSTPHDTRIYLYDNDFEQLNPDADWTASDFVINNCMAVKECAFFHAKGNTFTGFKGSALEFLQNHGVNTVRKSVYLLENNTYINCGFTSDYNEYQGAYRLQGEGDASITQGLGFLTVINDKFINCSYGSLLLSPNAGIAAQKVSIDVEVYGKHINAYYSQGSETYSNYFIKASYDVKPESLNLWDLKGLAFELEFKTDDGSITEAIDIKYIKTIGTNYNMIAQSTFNPVGTVGFIPNRSGDKVNILNPRVGDYLIYIFAQNKWNGVGRVDITV